MKKIIGPNFHNELNAAGLQGLPFSWGEDGVYFQTETTRDKETGELIEKELISAADKKKVLALVAKHDPEKPDQFAYQIKRLVEYPNVGDQLDAILKQLNAMQMNGTVDLIPELDSVVGKWLAVKRKYPKPE